MTYVHSSNVNGYGPKESYCNAVREVKRIKNDLKRTGKSKSYINKLYNGMIGCPTCRIKCQCQCSKRDQKNKKNVQVKKKMEIKNVIKQDLDLNNLMN
jgi:hypothetical protein